jgi:ubiquinone/menaquinone biosynthesis C-methylase UbiE
VSFYEEGVSNSAAEGYDQKLVPWYFQHWADQMAELADPGPSDRILDLACGSGLITRTLLPRLDAEGRIQAVDLNAGMLAYASAVVDDDRITWHEADAGSLPFADDAVDIACCHQGFQFFPDKPAALSELRRVLRPGGRLVLGVWGPLDRNPLVASMHATFGPFLGDDLAAAMEGPCGFPDAADLSVLLDEAGFTQVRVQAHEKVAEHPDVRAAMDGQLDALPVVSAVQSLGQRRAELVEAMCSYHQAATSPDGTLRLPAVSNVAVATNA